MPVWIRENFDQIPLGSNLDARTKGRGDGIETPGIEEQVTRMISPNLTVIFDVVVRIYSYESTSPRNNTLVIARIRDHVRARRTRIQQPHAWRPLAAVAGVPSQPGRPGHAAAASLQVSRRRRRPRRRNLAFPLATKRMPAAPMRTATRDDGMQTNRPAAAARNPMAASASRDPALPPFTPTAAAHGDGAGVE